MRASALVVIAIESVLCSAMLFAAHALPLNSKTLEPAMVAEKKWAYPAAFAYYAAGMAIPIAAVHFLFERTRHQK